MILAKRPRRFYLLKQFAASDAEDVGLESVWRAKQLAIAGTALPSDFPAQAQLLAAKYEAVEDIDGADEQELVSRAGLTFLAAKAVIAAATAALT